MVLELLKASANAQNIASPVIGQNHPVEDGDEGDEELKANRLPEIHLARAGLFTTSLMLRLNK